MKHVFEIFNFVDFRLVFQFRERYSIEKKLAMHEISLFDSTNFALDESTFVSKFIIE